MIIQNFNIFILSIFDFPGEAFIVSKALRTMTFTSSPPRRLAVLQQSIAVLPPPKTTTRFPIFDVCPNATLINQSMPMWKFSPTSSLPGILRSRPRGAPVPTKTAVEVFVKNLFQTRNFLVKTCLNTKV